MHAASWATDPKHLGFTLARYHFVARMLQGCVDVVEVGAGDGTGAPIVRAVVGKLTLTDKPDWNPIERTYRRRVNAIYALDVLEHIEPANEWPFLRNITHSLMPDGVAIFGSPSKESQHWASAISAKHHVNCHTEETLRHTLMHHFGNVFLFGMNDMTLHTGFGPMCHYRLALCTSSGG